MAKEPKKITRKREKKQKPTGDLPGIEGPGVAPVRIPKIEALADDYFKEKEKRCQQTPKEIAAKNKLIEALHEHAEEIGRNPTDQSIRYQYGDMVVLLKPGKEALQVKEVRAFEGEDVH